MQKHKLNKKLISPTAQVWSSCGDSLQDLLLIFSNIEAPPFDKFKSILKKGKISLASDIQVTALSKEWSEFNDLPHIIENTLAKYTEHKSELAFLMRLKDKLIDINKLINNFKEAESELNKNSNSKKINAAFCENELEHIYKLVKAVCHEIRNVHWGRLIAFEENLTHQISVVGTKPSVTLRQFIESECTPC
jgi:hypothetical protein